MSAPRLRNALLAASVGLAVLAGVMLPGSALAQDEEALRQYIERTGEFIQEAADQVRASDSVRARLVLQEAIRLHENSIEMGHNGHRAQAFQLSRRARTTAEHAVRLARESLGLEERARQRMERYTEFRDQILDRAREAGDDRALHFIHESERQALRAHEQYRQGNYAMALNLIEPAEALLARAARLLFEGGGAERLRRELEHTGEYIDDVTDRLAARPDGGGEGARDLLQSAREALLRAEDFFGRGQPLRCLNSLRVARRLAGQAAEAVREAIDPDTVAQQIERWDERYTAVAESVTDSGSEAARTTLDRAHHHRDRAEQQLQDGDVELALRQLRAAFDLLNEASDLAR